MLLSCNCTAIMAQKLCFSFSSTVLLLILFTSTFYNKKIILSQRNSNKKWTSIKWSPFHLFSKLIRTNIENQYLFKLNCSSFILIRFPLYTATKRLSLWTCLAWNDAEKNGDYFWRMNMLMGEPVIVQLSLILFSKNRLYGSLMYWGKFA